MPELAAPEAAALLDPAGARRAPSVGAIARFVRAPAQAWLSVDAFPPGTAPRGVCRGQERKERCMFRTLSVLSTAVALTLVAAGCASAKRAAASPAMHQAATTQPAPTQAAENSAPPATTMPATEPLPTSETASAPPANSSGSASGKPGAHLPKTASDRPLILLVGLSSLAAGEGLRRALRA